MGYALVPVEDAKEATFQFKLNRGYIGGANITYFDIVSNWNGTDVDDVEKVLLVVSSEEFESVKNFLTMLRS